MIPNKPHSNGIYREACPICCKQIYIHDSALVCSLDGSIYHSKCFKIINSSAKEIRGYDDWFCPNCCRDIFPFFDEDAKTLNDLNSIQVMCNVCHKFISCRNDRITHCNICLEIAHERCLVHDSCSKCLPVSDSPHLLVEAFFNPYAQDLDPEHFDFDQDETEEFCSTLTTASEILSNCSTLTPQEFNMKFTNSMHTHVYYHNIDGFKANFIEFRNQANLFETSFKFYCFVETNLHEGVAHDFEIENYYSEHLYAIEDKKKGSGISVYFHNSMSFSDISTTRNKYFECLGGSINTDFGVCNLVVFYRFNKHVNDDFFDNLSNTLDNYANKPCIVLGDFNFNCFNYESDSTISRYCELFFGYGLSPLISKTTHTFRSSSTLIDQIWSNYFTENTSSSIIDSSVSNHRPLVLSIPLTQSSYIENDLESDKEPKRFLFHNVSPQNFERFGREFNSYFNNFNVTAQNVIPNELSSSKSTAQENFSDFFSTFKNLYNKHIVEELDLNSSSRRNHYFKPWITLAISKSCKVKNLLYRAWVKSRGSPNETIAMTVYKSYRAKLRDIVRMRRNDYFRDKFTRAGGNIKKCWQIVNEIRCKKNKLTLPDKITVDTGQIISDRRRICIHFNNYFTNVANNLNADKYDNYIGTVPNFRDFLKSPVQNSIFLKPIVFSEIHDIIRNLNSNKSSDFSPRVLKLFNFQFSTILTPLFNDCMRNAIFPDELKIAKVLPLYKTGDRNVLSNYRPISILPIFSKIFEKLIQSRLTSFLEKEKVLFDGQFGFRRNRSTIQALNTSICNVLKSIDARKNTIGIFIDYSKAFDTIRHSILLDKLYHYGIRGTAHQLLTNYLANRSQYVYFDQNTLSDVLNISCGVPQGSVLGPLLFIVYINDITHCQCACDEYICKGDCSKENIFVLFADDCNSFISDESISGVFKKANDLINRLKVYIDANYLHINLKKSKFMYFKAPNRKHETAIDSFTLKYDDTPLQRVKSIKFLGVYIDESLNWSTHLAHVAKKLANVNGVLYQIRKTVPRILLVSIFNALIQSHLSYGISVWGCGGDTAKLQKLFVAQKKAIRTVFGVRRIKKHLVGNTKSTFNENNTLTVHNLYVKSVLSETYPIMYYTNHPRSLSDNFNVSNVDNQRFMVPRVHYSKNHKNFYYYVPKLWNLIRSSCEFPKNFKSVKTFKNAIKKFILKYQSLGKRNEWEPANVNIEKYMIARSRNAPPS